MLLHYPCFPTFSLVAFCGGGGSCFQCPCPDAHSPPTFPTCISSLASHDYPPLSNIILDQSIVRNHDTPLTKSHLFFPLTVHPLNLVRTPTFPPDPKENNLTSFFHLALIRLRQPYCDISIHLYCEAVAFHFCTKDSCCRASASMPVNTVFPFAFLMLFTCPLPPFCFS